MAEGEQSSAEKEFEATEQKRQQARKEGNVAQSKELNAFVLTGAIIVAVLLFRGPLGEAYFRDLSAILLYTDDLALDLQPGGGGDKIRSMVVSLVFALVPFLAVLLISVFASVFLQRAISFSTKKIKPDVKKISPVENIKKKYGPRGLIDFSKDTAKMIIAGTIAVVFLLQFAFNYGASFSTGPGPLVDLAFDQSFNLVLCFFVFQACIAVIDLPIQWQMHAKELKMTREEMKKQMKESEGDPYLKQSRKEKGTKISRGEMLQNVKGSTVVMVNPTHYAVALKWDRASASAPICVAKGVDHLAATIRDVAIASGVPIYRDPAATRSIYSLVEVDEEIRPEHFAAVAAAIQYVERVRKVEVG